MAQAATNPYVMVKHGRREDRAATYDRFIAACGAFFFDGQVDRYVVTELLASLQAVELRAPKHVRLAANDLFEYITSVDTTEGGPTPSLSWTTLTRSARLSGTRDEWELGGDEVVSSSTLLMGLREFTEAARLDVLGRWWHVLLSPWGKRWWLARR